MSERARRLFFALWPSDELRQQIEHETRNPARLSGGRTIPAANLHITLAFLGSVSEAKIEDAKRSGNAAAVQPFELILGELTWWERQQLLCLEPTEGAEALQDLAGRLHTELRARGFMVELRPFRAHVTVAREVVRAHDFKLINQLRWQVNRLELVESRTLPSGSVYTVLPT